MVDLQVRTEPTQGPRLDYFVGLQVLTESTQGPRLDSLVDLRPQTRWVRLTQNCHTSSNSSHMHLHLHYNPVITMVLDHEQGGNAS